MEEILSAALILVACISGGVSCAYIARSRSTTNKHSRQRIKDFEADIKSIAESKRVSNDTDRVEIRRLQQALNRSKRGETVTDSDMKNSGLGEVIMQLVPGKYRKAASFLIPQIEEAVKKDPTLIEKVYERIKSANTTSNQQTEPGTETQAVQTL